MSYIKLHPEESTDPSINEVFEEIKKAKGFVPAPYRAFALQPQILQANWNKTKQVLTKGNIPGLLKEQIALAVSTANNCTFCINIHTDNLKQKGLSDEEIASTAKAESKDEKTDFILKFVVQATKDPHKLSQTDFDKLRNFGYSDEDVLEILTVMEMYSGYNKIVSALHLEIND